MQNLCLIFKFLYQINVFQYQFPTNFEITTYTCIHAHTYIHNQNCCKDESVLLILQYVSQIDRIDSTLVTLKYILNFHKFEVAICSIEYSPVSILFSGLYNAYICVRVHILIIYIYNFRKILYFAANSEIEYNCGWQVIGNAASTFILQILCVCLKLLS